MSDASEEVRQEASKIGWQPKEAFKGDAATWVDADEYLRRGREVLPLVKAENKRLHEKTDQLTREVQKLTQAVAEQQQSMAEFADFNAEQLRTQLDDQAKRIRAELREARREENDTRVEELEENLEENREAKAKLGDPKEKKAAATPPTTPQSVQQTPEYLDWAARNPWFNGTSRADQAKTAAAMRFATEMATAGKRGTAFFEAVDEALAEVYPQQRRTEPTEEGRPSSGSSGSGSSGSGFASLPSDAKAKAKEQAPKFVGPNKMFKDEKAWFDYYAKQYAEVQ